MALQRFRRLVTNAIRPGDPTINVAVQEWQAMPAIQNTWTETDTGYWIDPWGVVHLRGHVTPGTKVNPTTIYTFPVHMRPGVQQVFICASTGAVVTSHLILNTNGNLDWRLGDLCYLDLITWRIDY